MQQLQTINKDLGYVIGHDYPRCSRKCIFIGEHALRVIYFPEEIIFSATQQKSRILRKIHKNAEIRKNPEMYYPCLWVQIRATCYKMIYF